MIKNPERYQTVKDMETFKRLLAEKSLENCVLWGLDLCDLSVDWSSLNPLPSTLIGCQLASLEHEMILRNRGTSVFAPVKGLPYDPFRASLYTAAELMAGYSQDPICNNSLDTRINRHFDEHGGHDPDIIEALAQRIHDFSIDEAIKELLGIDQASKLPLKKAVGFMGGHLCRRDDVYYRKTAQLAGMMTREGYFVVSGGGPGIMEAANLGAYLAFAGAEALDNALETLSLVPEYVHENGDIDPGYVRQALSVHNEYPQGAESLAIPTWFYGHEPVNLFASHIGKYFSNSLREDGLLSISMYGVVYDPGSAATTQEVFQDAAQNHYGTLDFYSPMVFLGANHYLQSQVYTCLTQQAAGNVYAQLITISDEPVKLLDFIKKHKPISKAAEKHAQANRQRQFSL